MTQSAWLIFILNNSDHKQLRSEADPSMSHLHIYTRHLIWNLTIIKLVMAQWSYMASWNLGQYWLRLCLAAWRHQDITWSNLDQPSKRFISIQLRGILQVTLKLSVTIMCAKIKHLNFWPNLPGANVLWLAQQGSYNQIIVVSQMDYVCDPHEDKGRAQCIINTLLFKPENFMISKQKN